MSIGKYSPTVNKSYLSDQDWWKNHCAAANSLYDKDGYDSYGYNEKGRDRAGYDESSYLNDNRIIIRSDESEEIVYDLYENILEEYNSKPIIGKII